MYSIQYNEQAAKYLTRLDIIRTIHGIDVSSVTHRTRLHIPEQVSTSV